MPARSGLAEGGLLLLRHLVDKRLRGRSHPSAGRYVEFRWSPDTRRDVRPVAMTVTAVAVGSARYGSQRLDPAVPDGACRMEITSGSWTTSPTSATAIQPAQSSPRSSALPGGEPTSTKPKRTPQ